MTSKRITPLLLAASVFLSGATTLYIGAMTPSHAITSVDELSDINRNHWAFEALRDLVEKYDVIEGYPDHTFRGNRMPTRWEMAAALNALLKTVGKDLARLGAEKANKTDLQTLAKLQEELRVELQALSGRVGVLEARASAIEAKNQEQDNRLSLLEKTQIHGDMSFGGLADIGANGTHDPNHSGDDGISDGLSTIGRLRLSLDIPVKEDTEDSKLGEGRVYTRMVAAFGRQAPNAVEQGNLGGFNPFNGYSRIAADSSAFNETVSGSTGVAGNGGNTRANLYVESAYYKQNLKSGIPLLTDLFPGMGVMPDGDEWKATADIYAGLIPWRFLFDKSPYRGNELTQFQNSAFVNTPGIAVNYNMPMVAYALHQGLGKSMSLDLTAGVGSIDVSNAYNALNATYEARLNYLTTFLGPEFTKPGNVYAGGYNIWGSGNNDIYTRVFAGNNLAGGANGAVQQAAALRNRSGGSLANSKNVDGTVSTNAFYVGWNQEFYKGIGLNVGYLLQGTGRQGIVYTSLNQSIGANNAFNREGIGVSARQALSATMNFPMSAIAPGFRDKDAFGIGYALVDLHEAGLGRGNYLTNTVNFNGAAAAPSRNVSNRFGDAAEQVCEFYYRYQLNDSISIVPSFQLIFNRLGLDANDVTSVIGLRTNYTF